MAANGAQLAGRRAEKKKQQPIKIKLIRRHERPRAHAWKVAYADFVTALMAFFLLMWLLQVTTPQQRRVIADGFGKASVIKAPGGASTSMIKLGGHKDMPSGPVPRESSGSQRKRNEAELKRLAAQQDRRRLQALEVDLKKAIGHSQALKPFKDQLLLDISPRGLRIQIVDKQNRPMFNLGSAVLKPYARKILVHIGQFIHRVPNQITITGHTDAHHFAGTGMTNWELSTERANSARRALLQGGMQPGKIARIVGLGDTVLFDKANPMDPINRRISIIVLSKREEAAMARGDRYR